MMIPNSVLYHHIRIKDYTTEEAILFPTNLPIAQQAWRLYPHVIPSTFNISQAKYNHGQIVDSQVFEFTWDVSTHHAVTNSSPGRRLISESGIQFPNQSASCLRSSFLRTEIWECVSILSFASIASQKRFGRCCESIVVISFFGVSFHEPNKRVSRLSDFIEAIGIKRICIGLSLLTVSNAISEATIKANGHEIPKWVRSTGEGEVALSLFHNKNSTTASWKESQLQACNRVSLVIKLFKEGPSVVIVWPHLLANAYPSQLDPVWAYAFPHVVKTTMSTSYVFWSDVRTYVSDNSLYWISVIGSFTCISMFRLEKRWVNIRTTSFPSLLTGKMRLSDSSLHAIHCSSNHFLTSLGQNFPMAVDKKSQPLVYAFLRSCFFIYQVVRLQRPHHEIITFAHKDAFFSNKYIFPLHRGSSMSVAATIIPAAHPPTIAIHFSWYVIIFLGIKTVIYASYRKILGYRSIQMQYIYHKITKNTCIQHFLHYS